MRSLMLASAAFIVSAGVACAQTASPAPTGATNAPVVSSAPGASPGNTAPATPMGAATQSPAPMASSGSPAPDGAISSPTVTQPGTSPGRTAPAPAQSAMTAPHHKHWGMGHNMTVPEDADARTYLHIASDAIKHNNKAVADDALSHAETRLLTRAVPQSSSIPVDDSDSVTAIEHARQAVASGDMAVAMTDTREAMHTMHGGMMAGQMDAPDAAPQPAPGGMTPTPPAGSVSATAGGM